MRKSGYQGLRFLFLKEKYMQENKMATMKMPKLLLNMGLPMIISMILQAVYNVVDTIFVVNKEGLGQTANQALTFAFPIQILLIAIGVGTGVGINAILSKSLGEKDRILAGKICGNGIFLSMVICLLFVIFGLFFTRPYMKYMARNIDESVFNKQVVIDMGTDYLSICCIYSIGAIGYAVFERFLQASGRTMFSTIAQVSGAVFNIFGDWVLIYYTDLGVKGAAIATVAGQILSLVVAMLFHYLSNKEIDKSLKHTKPSWNIIKMIYIIGLPAMIMQALLAIMMFVVIEILGTNAEMGTVLQGAFGIYYKIMQIALFACFGLSNTLISVVSFNRGLGDEKRVKDSIKCGIMYSLILALLITAIFQVLARPISNLFGMTLSDGEEEIINLSVNAMHIATIGYVFMGYSVAVQGILQGYRSVYLPLLISFLRLIVFVVPFAFLFLNIGDVQYAFWWTFPVAEVLTAFVSFFLLQYKLKRTESNNKKEENVI